MPEFKDFKFRGVWLTPEGKTIETNDIHSHRLVLRQPEIWDNIMSLAIKMDIPTDDMSVTAMKVGYIRILNYGNQIAVELIANPSSVQVEAILSKVREYRLDLYRTHAIIIDDFVVENPEASDVKTFHSVSELSDYLNSISVKTEC